MTEKTNFKSHFTCLSALFILGSGIITLPTKNADRYTLYTLIISVLFTFLIYFILSLIQKYFLEKTQNSKIFKIFSAIIYTAISVYALFTFAYTFKIFTRFAAHILLRDTSFLTAAILLGLVVWFFASRKQVDILKFSLICLVAALPVILFFFFGAMDDYKIDNIFIYNLPEFKNLLKNLYPFLKEISFPIIILFSFASSHKETTKSTISGIFIGYILLFLCISSAVMLFGSTFAARIEYPYTAAVSTVSVGRLFTRMDYFSYFIYFTSAIIKITVCLFTVKECLKKIKEIM